MVHQIQKMGNYHSKRFFQDVGVSSLQRSEKGIDQLFQLIKIINFVGNGKVFFISFSFN